jgi:hypothetical protein
MRFVAAVLAIGIGVHVTGFAQTFVDVGPMGSFLNTRTPRFGAPTNPSKGIGGSSYGLVIESGWTGSPLGWHVELAIPRAFEIEQTAPLYKSQGRYRDVVLSGLGCFCQSRHIEVLAGMSYVRQQLRRELAFHNTISYAPFSGRLEPSNETVWAVTGGIGVRAKIARHIDLVPQVRVHVVNRSNQDFSLFLGSFIVQPSIVARYNFR